ncbi:hypothetical protein NM688_g7330 [Phlebia brevispora]|uniref:Uncharacterized protein n=1 Tax=Phlebia brevispora TaxID=194682 RepID=A0ACC1S6E0_9APHY|nr:hypothetical protein NM688_g7330 [Phlebia brevispora]
MQLFKYFRCCEVAEFVPILLRKQMQALNSSARLDVTLSIDLDLNLDYDLDCTDVYLRDDRLGIPGCLLTIS